MNIILFGYRGSGKTTVGKLLADQLWKTFADVDGECCKRLGDDSIAHIWQVQGEPVWRKTEIEVTREFCAGDELVIALGGGTLMQPEARTAVERAPQAVRIYLYCQPEELARRVAGDTRSAQTRPVLTNLGGGLEEIQAMLAQRDPVYRAVADKVFDVTHVTAADAVRHLIARCL
jgi:shikimate kinase